LVVTSSFGHRKGTLIFAALCVVDVPIFTSGAFLIGFAIPGGAIDADIEDRTTPEGWKEELLGEGFGEGLRRALRLVGPYEATCEGKVRVNFKARRHYKGQNILCTTPRKVQRT